MARHPSEVHDALFSPVESSAHFERVDQGVDYTGQPGTFIHAIGSGTVHVGRAVAAGTGTVYEHLDQPVTVGGRRYTDVYYGESNPVLHGGRVQAGQAIAAYTSDDTSSELGFSTGGGWGPLIGGLGSGTKAGQQGVDFAAFIRGLGAPGIPSDLGTLPNLAPGARDPGAAIPGSFGVFHPGTTNPVNSAVGSAVGAVSGVLPWLPLPGEPGPIGSAIGLPNILGDIPKGLSALGQIAAILGKVVSFIFSTRFLFIIGGTILIVLALRRLVAPAAEKAAPAIAAAAV